MSVTKTECAKCGTLIVLSTATDTGGLCRPCEAGPNFQTVSDGFEFGLRFAMALLFACIAAGIGYTIGSLLGVLGGLFLAVPFAAVGLIYGFFVMEVNSIIRSVFGWFVEP